MSDADQVNIRVPTSAKRTVHRIARLLREDPAFLRRIDRFLEEDATADRSGFIADRLDRLETTVAIIVAQLGGEAETYRELKKDAAPSSPWTTGTGKGRRLTPTGEAELQRLVATGMSNSDIARALGIRSFSVTRQRRKLQAPKASQNEGSD